MAGNVTLADVARVAGVSLATASRAFNGSASRRVGADLRERVRAAAAELDYWPNAQAQAVASGQTSLVGLIVHDIADPYFSTIAAGVMREAERHGLVITIASAQRDPGRELEYVGLLRRQRARAMILAGSRVDDRRRLDRLGEELASFQSAGGRVTMVSQQRLPIDTMLIENRAGARALAEALHALGYRRFAVLAGPSALLTARDRSTGFREALARRDCLVPAEHLVRGEFTRDGGYEAMTQVLDRHLDVSCVFAVNDVMAVGAMAALRDRGVDVGGAVAVAGFDDIATLRDVTPGLTTVRLPLERIGREALDLALSDPADRPRVRRIFGEVVLRDSTPAQVRTSA